jgi:lipoprotein-anchoring transpeptidase ErfK/SrfK
VSSRSSLAAAGLAGLIALPASAQTFYQPEPMALAARETTREAVAPRLPRQQARFFLPFLAGLNHGQSAEEERHPGGAVATSPSGRRVYYIPAPEAEAPRQVARATQGDEGFVDVEAPRSRGAIDPRFRRQEVDYAGPHRPGTIVIDTAQRFLFLVLPNGRALRYGVGVGREGFSWRGEQTISRMAEWPDWRPPPEMLARRPDLPRFMPGGPSNPMGARGLYLGSSLYRIHGTNEPHTIGQAVSSGCIRMTNEDVADLYARVRVGTRVVVL